MKKILLILLLATLTQSITEVKAIELEENNTGQVTIRNASISGQQVYIYYNNYGSGWDLVGDYHIPGNRSITIDLGDALYNYGYMVKGDYGVTSFYSNNITIY